MTITISLYDCHPAAIQVQFDVVILEKVLNKYEIGRPSAAALSPIWRFNEIDLLRNKRKTENTTIGHVQYKLNLIQIYIL